MKKIALIALAVMFCLSTGAFAKDLSQGTISLGGDSTMAYESSETDYEGGPSVDSDAYGLDVAAGYFIIDNLEIGLSLLFDSEEAGNVETTSLGFSPFAMYHLPVSDPMNVVVGAQVGYFDAEVDNGSRSSDGDGLGFILGAGIEYFIVDPVALDCSLTYRRINFEFNGGGSSYDVDDTVIRIGMGVTVYIQ